MRELKYKRNYPFFYNTNNCRQIAESPMKDKPYLLTQNNNI